MGYTFLRLVAQKSVNTSSRCDVGKQYQAFTVDFLINNNHNAHILSFNEDNPYADWVTNIIGTGVNSVFRDMMTLMGISSHGMYGGMLGTSTAILRYCENQLNVRLTEISEEADRLQFSRSCNVHLQRFHDALDDMLAEHTNRGQYSLIFPTSGPLISACTQCGVPCS
eukprot:m.576614 g.576614  ORF g.576614 m.576614 type:complete len:168 (+) comp57901_c0_seq2:1809-2312(+)